MKWRFFQIHLLTAVVGMLSVGLFLWLNLNERSIKFLATSYDADERTFCYEPVSYFYLGWPMDVMYEIDRLRHPTVLLVEKRNRDRLVDTESWRQMLILEVSAEVLDRWNRLEKTGRLGDWTVLTQEDLVRQMPEMHQEVHQFWPEVYRMRLPQSHAPISIHAIVFNFVVALVATLAQMTTVEWFLRGRERAKV